MRHERGWTRPDIILTICAMLGACGLLAGDIAFNRQQAQAQPPAARASGSLTAFRSDAELRRFLRRLRAAQEPQPMPVMMPSAPSPPAEAAAAPQ